MPFLLFISFCFPPLLRARDRANGSVEAGGRRVPGPLRAAQPAPGDGDRSGPRVPAAGSQHSPLPRTPAPLRVIRGLCSGCLSAPFSAVAGGKPAGPNRPAARCPLGGRRGDTGTLSLAPRASGAGGAGGASAPGRGQPAAPRPCVRPSRGAGRQSPPDSAAGCARHRPRLRFRFFPARSGRRRWATAEQPRVAPGPARPSPIWAPAGAGAGSRWRISLSSPGRWLRQRRSRGLGLASKLARGRGQRPLRGCLGAREGTGGRGGPRPVPARGAAGPLGRQPGPGLLFGGRERGCGSSARSGLRGQLAPPERGCQGRNPVPGVSAPLPLLEGPAPEPMGDVTRRRWVQAGLCPAACRSASPPGPSAGSLQGRKQQPPTRSQKSVGGRRDQSPLCRGAAQRLRPWEEGCGPPTGPGPALPPVPRPWPEQEGGGSGGAAEGLLSRASRGAGLRETGLLRDAGAQAAPCCAQGAAGPSCCPGGREGRNEPSPYTNTDVMGGERLEQGGEQCRGQRGTQPRLTRLGPVALPAAAGSGALAWGL